MVRHLAVGLVFTVLPLHAAGAPETASSADGRALVEIASPPPGALEALLAEGIVVVRDLGTIALAVAGPSDLRTLAGSRLDWTVLDRDIAGKTFYTVGYRDEIALRATPGIRVLSAADGTAVVEGAPAAAEALSANGMHLARVFLRPIRLADPDAAPRSRAASWDPEIQQVADAVSGANVDASVLRLQNFVTRYSDSDSCLAAANWIKAQFESCGIDSVFLHAWSPWYKPNVVAVIPGRSEPQRTVLIGGHYDSTTGNHAFCPGADDDASGTACVLECARVLAAHDFAYTIVFVAFCAEEQGLLGSEAYAAAVQARGEDLVAAVCVDMIGYVAPGDAVDLDIVDNPASLWLRTLALEMGPLYVPDLPVVDGSIPGGASSDHASFWAHGYPAILFFEDTGSYSPYIHTANDVVGTSYNSPVLARRSVQVAAALLATLAEPFRVAIAHEELPDTPDTVNPYRVACTILAEEALDPASLLVHWATPFASGSVPLSMAGPPEAYEAWIPAQPGGVTVEYWIAAADVSGHSAASPKGAPSATHSFFVGSVTTLWADDFEADRGWTIGAADDDATEGFWLRADPVGTWWNSLPVQPEDDHTPGAGITCFVTANGVPGDPQGRADVDGGKTTITSPVLDLAGASNASVRYHRWFTNSTGGSPGLDPWAVDVSADGGSTWVGLEATTASDRSWRLVERDLGSYVPLTSQMRFRFVARDNFPNSVIEAGLDDFSIVAYEEPAVDAPVSRAPGAAAIALSRSFPNPGRRASILLTVPGDPRPVTLSVVDLAGRHVATLLRGEPVSGVRRAEWNGRDEGGHEAAAGIYFWRLEAGDRMLSRKLVLLR